VPNEQRGTLRAPRPNRGDEPLRSADVGTAHSRGRTNVRLPASPRSLVIAISGRALAGLISQRQFGLTASVLDYECLLAFQGGSVRAV